MSIKPILLFLLLFFSSLAAQSQARKISGTVYYETEEVPANLALVQIFRVRDSVLLKFGRCRNDGTFNITTTDTGTLVFNIRYPGCVIFYDTIRAGYHNTTIPPVVMLSAIKTLETVIIKGYTNGIRLSGDTTEYLADFFKTNPGATVEDLLKKLPGIQVNKSGEITAQGQKVKKILVDGEEFFAEDPGIATKYLRADMIDKVQVYEEDKDTLSGSVGTDNKTINLTMKDGKKKGTFGKLEAGSNFNEYTKAGAFLGYFNEDVKTALYIKNSNFENSALNWQESKQFGGAATGGEVTQMGMYSYTSNGVSFNDQLDRRGIPGNTSIGAVANYKFSKKLRINTSYRYATERLNGTVQRNSDYFLPDTSYTLTDSAVNSYQQDGHRLNMTLTANPDSLNVLTFSGSVGLNSGKSNAVSEGSTLGALTINDNQRDLEKEYTRQLIQLSGSWAKQFSKKGRTLDISANSSFNPSTQSEDLTGTTRFYNEAGNVKDKITTGQKSTTDYQSLGLGISANYRDHLSEKLIFSANYSINSNTDRNNTNTLNTLMGDAIIDSLSNNFNFANTMNRGGVSLNYKTAKWNYWTGLNSGITQYKQENITLGTEFKQQFINFLPNAGINYIWQKQSSVQVSYSGQNQAPSLSAIQPVVNNNDQLNRTIGNPNLIQSFRHNFYANINSYQILKGRFLWGYANFSVPKNAFVTSIQIDSSGIRRTMTVNADGNYNFNSSFNFNKKIKKLPMYMGISGGYSKSRNISFNNGQKVTTISTNPNAGLELSLNTDKVELSVEYEVRYHTNQSNLSGNAVNSYFIHIPSYYLEVQLPANFGIETEGDFNIRPTSPLFEKQRNVFYVNGAVTKTFTKNRNLELRFSVNDLLNQNIGFNRNISSNLVTEEIYTQLSRYWLFHIRWNFTKAGGMK